MKAALLQLTTDLAQPFESRVAHACELISAQREADLVVLPELWPTGYFAFGSYQLTAEPLEGPVCQALAAAVRRAGCHVVAGSFVEAAGRGEMFNTTLLFTPDGRLAHVYRKFHLFGYRSREASLLRPGEKLDTYQAPFGRIGMATCYDLRFPELFRVLVSLGAEIIVVVAAWPMARLEHWRLLTRARAVENQCFVLACNGAGTQAGTEVAGHSAVLGPWGDVLAEAGVAAEILRADIDPCEVARVRTEFPALAGRRLEVGFRANLSPAE